MKKKWFFVALVVIVVGGLFVYGRSKAKEVDALAALLAEYENQSGANDKSSDDLDLNALLGELSSEGESSSDLDLNALLGELSSEGKSSGDLDLNALLGELGSSGTTEQDSSGVDAILDALGGLTAKEEENGDSLDAILGALNELNNNALTEEGLESMINEFLWGESEEEVQIVPGELSVEFKQTMDNYEAICDEYVAFMKKCQNADEATLMSMYSEIIAYVENGTAMSEQVEALKKGPMTTGEYEYYLEVMERVEKKMDGAQW